MRASFRFIARAAALVATLVVGAACTERVLVPQQQAVQLQLDLASQVAGGSRSVTVRVRYQTASGGVVSLLDQTTTVATGTQQLSVPVDLSKCLADAAHVGGPTTCRLRVTVELRDAASGTLLDTVELAAIDASPGAAPAATTVTVAAVSTITVTGINSTLIQGQTAQATGVVKDAAGNTLGRPITWATSNAAVAVVSAAGLVTGVAPGTAQITATAGGVSQSTSVTVIVAVSTITVTGIPGTMIVGQTAQATAVARDAAGNTLARPITWSSTPGVVVVSSTGVVTAVAPGVAQITATSEGVSQVTTVIVVAPASVASISVTPTSATLAAGQTAQIVATLFDANNNVLTGRSVGYSSSAAVVATVSSTGLVTAISAGTAVITVSSEGRTATVSITVRLASVTPTSLGVTHTVGVSSCPQAIGAIVITNTSGAAVNFTASVPHASLGISVAAGGIANGATAQIAVSFNCASTASVASSVSITVRNLANTVVETFTVTVTVPVVFP